MNTRTLLIFATAALLGLTVRVQSQAPAAPAAAPKTSLQLLQTMKEQNQTLLDKQAALMTKLDELKDQASQIKFLSKRG